MTSGPILIKRRRSHSKALSARQKRALQLRLRSTLRDPPYDGNQTKLAAAIGIRQPTLSDFLNHGTKAGFGFLQSMAAFFGCPIEELLKPPLAA